MKFNQELTDLIVKHTGLNERRCMIQGLSIDVEVNEPTDICIDFILIDETE